MKTEELSHVCQVCGKTKNKNELVPVPMIRKSIVAVIKKENPALKDDGYICADDYRHFREEHIVDMLEVERGKLSELDAAVAGSIHDKELLSKNINAAFTEKLSFGDKTADKIAAFGGSWKFIISFSAFILIWIVLNSAILLSKAFDPYPFILLNLMLSCLAALQAPVIMMSQNRQEAKDRMRGEHDYQVNLKAELEVRSLNDKIEILLREWESMTEMQNLQLELLKEMAQMKEAKE